MSVGYVKICDFTINFWYEINLLFVHSNIQINSELAKNPLVILSLKVIGSLSRNFYKHQSLLIFASLMHKQKDKVDQFRLRQVIIAALLFMMIGTVLELYLLDHYEDALQLIPILCIGTSLLLMIILLVRKSNVVIRLFQIVLSITALSGLYGTFLHLRANFEFEQEMKPTAENWDVFVESLSGALPSLAPASMIVLALIGYAYLILIKQQQ